MEQTGVTASAASDCNPGLACTYDPATAHAAAWALAGVSPCLSQTFLHNAGHFYTMLGIYFFIHRNKICIILCHDRISKHLTPELLFITGF